jgi:hypothetical protein
MKDYIIKIMRGIEIEEDFLNFLKSKGCLVTYSNQEAAPRTLGIKSEMTVDGLMKLRYIENATEAPVGRLGS